MQNMSVQTAVCKSIQSVGISPRKEHQIENVVVIQLRSNGPEYLLSRLSSLSDWRKMHMRGDISYHPPWFAYKQSKGAAVPADKLGSQIWTLSDKAFFAVVGALRKSIELSIPSEKQLTKWIEAVRCDNKSDDAYHIRPISGYDCAQYEKLLTKYWTGRDWFNVSDITGTNIPGSAKFVNVKYDDEMIKDPLSLLSAYGFSVNTSPLFVWQFLKDIDAPTLMSNGKSNPDELSDSLKHLIDSKLKSYSLMDEAEMGSSFVDDATFLSGKKYVDYNMGFCHSVGNIGFLEQAGGKLRTVANPNRLVQYVNRPLGDIMSRLTYRQAGIFVMNQEAGFKWAQEKLRKGVSLSSFDMSSATDRLDYSKFLHDYFKNAYDHPKDYPLLVRSLELFEDTSSSPWSIPGHIADLLGTNSTDISWTVGQPLGLRPSFPLLTMMNAAFAMKACERQLSTGFPPSPRFACVGDDLIIETEFADTYMKWVKAYNGQINNDKTMVSDRYAEFCSHLVTKSTVYPLKPRFIEGIEGSFNNVEKFSTKGLQPKVPGWLRELHDSISSFAISGAKKIPYYVSFTPRSLNERLSVNTLIEVISEPERDPEKVTLQTLYLRAEEEFTRNNGLMLAKDLTSSYASTAYPKFGGKSESPEVHQKMNSVPIHDYHEDIGLVSSDRSTSVDLPIKTEWDYRSASYKKRHSVVSDAKKLSKTISKIKTSQTDDLVESVFVKDNIETRIVMDTNSDCLDTLVAHRNIMSATPCESVQVVEPSQPIKDAAADRIARRLAALQQRLDDASDDAQYDDQFDI